jgi:Tol biopolymer transport system component
MDSWPINTLPATTRRLARTAIAGGVVLVAAVCTDDVAGPEDLDFDQERLIFVSSRGDIAKGIYRMNADGTGVESLTDQREGYANLSLSPDGRRVAFRCTGCGGSLNIFVMDTDGANLSQLTGVKPLEWRNYHPRWSPDGTQIAFATTREPTQQPYWKVYVMNADGSDPHYISGPIGENGGVYTRPVGWSPDGRVVFHHLTGDDANPLHTYIVNAVGGDPEPLFDQPGDHSPAWSPDGTKMAFIRGWKHLDGEGALYVMNADGSGVVKLSDHDSQHLLSTGWSGAFFNDISPWSPDGTRIVFGMENELYVVNADGSGLRQLTDLPERERSVFNGWAPSGTRIAFTSNEDSRLRHGNSDVYVVNADGTGLVNLTGDPDNPTDDRDALWLPRH